MARDAKGNAARRRFTRRRAAGGSPKGVGGCIHPPVEQPPERIMINTILTKIIGTKNERELKAIAPLIKRIVALEPSVLPLSDSQLQAKTDEFRRRLKGGGGDGGGGESLDDLLPEAFAVVREAGRRVLNMRHFDVQLIGGLALHR